MRPLLARHGPYRFIARLARDTEWFRQAGAISLLAGNINIRKRGDTPTDAVDYSNEVIPIFFDILFVVCITVYNECNNKD